MTETLKNDAEYDEYMGELSAFETEKKAENDAKHLAVDKKKGTKRTAGSAGLAAGQLDIIYSIDFVKNEVK